MNPSLTATTAAAPVSPSLAQSLAPVVQQACQGRLSDITWFKTDWQRGGAATGYATYADNGESPAQVVLKLPVVQRELAWLGRLQQVDHANGIVPRLFAFGETLGGYDLAWVVIERLAHGPLAHHWHDSHVLRLAKAAARFHAAAAATPCDDPPPEEPWDELLAQALKNVKTNELHDDQRWVAAIKAAKSRLATWLAIWNGRPVNQWLHGDLHLANAMTRTDDPECDVCLIDLADVHCGHWVQDAVYLERQFWARPDRIQNHKPVKAIAAARRELGLSVESDYPRLAMIRRALLAATAPRFLKSEGRPAYLDACLRWLETALKELP